MKLTGKKSLFFLSLVVISTTNDCVNQRDYCYSEKVYDLQSQCELLTMAISDDKEVGPLFNVALASCLLAIEQVKKCEAKSNILPGTIGP
jgi:hypothetical protein